MFAKALGAEVYAFSHSSNKKEDAFKLGADHFIDTSVKGFEKPLEGEIDLIVTTASNVKSLPMSEFLTTLAVHGRLIYVGMPEEKLPQVTAQELSNNGCFIGSSHIGSKKEMLQMLQVAADKGIKAWKNIIPMKNAADGIMAVKNNTVRFRTVLQQGGWIMPASLSNIDILLSRSYGILILSDHVGKIERKVKEWTL